MLHHELGSSLFRQVLIITGSSVNCFALKITLVVYVEQEAYIYTGLRRQTPSLACIFTTASNSGQDRCQATPVGIRDTCLQTTEAHNKSYFLLPIWE